MGDNRRTKAKREKAGTSKAAALARKEDFARAYIANGKNGTQAAITAGYSAKTARSQAARLLADVNIRSLIEATERKHAEKAGLSIERTLQEVARLAYADPRKLYRADGTPLPINELDDDSAAVIAGVEVLEEFEGRGEERKLIGYTKKLKLWDKNAALEKAMKHLGLYEKDNSQRGESLSIKIELV